MQEQIKKYFDNLPPFDPERGSEIEKLASYVVTKDRNFAGELAMMLMRLVASVYTKKSNGKIFTLSGNGAIGKSEFIRFLCPKELINHEKHITKQITEQVRLVATKKLFIIIDIEVYHGFTELLSLKETAAANLINNKKVSGNFFAETILNLTGDERMIVFRIQNILHDNGGPEGYNRNVLIDRVYSEAYYLATQVYNLF